MRKIGEVSKLKCVLCKTGEFAGPHFDRVVIVHDGIIRFEATMVEVCHRVDARVVVVGIAWSCIIQKVTDGNAERVSRTASRNAVSSSGISPCHVVPYGI